MSESQSFQSWFKKALEESGKSVKDVVEATELSKPLIHFYLTGKRTPSVTSMTKIAQLLGADPEQLKAFTREVGRPKH